MAPATPIGLAGSRTSGALKPVLWRLVSVGLGMVTAMAARRAAAALWPGRHDPPLNPADRRIGWWQALAWAVVSGIGAGVARTMARRTAAAGWSRVFDEDPPGVAQAT